MFEWISDKSRQYPGSNWLVPRAWLAWPSLTGLMKRALLAYRSHFLAVRSERTVGVWCVDGCWVFLSRCAMAENVEPESKKLRLSLQKLRPKSRFERVDEKEMSVICKGYVLTLKRTLAGAWPCSTIGNRVETESQKKNSLTIYSSATKHRNWTFGFLVLWRRCVDLTASRTHPSVDSSLYAFRLYIVTRYCILVWLYIVSCMSENNEILHLELLY